MRFKVGDIVIVNREGKRYGDSGKVKSRNFWTYTVGFLDGDMELNESFYEHELSSGNVFGTSFMKAQEDQWDVTTRGQKMSGNSGKVIYKYQMPVLEKFTMKLPKGAEILRVADQDGMFWLWAVVDTNVPDEERHFVAVKCGANVPEGRILNYIGMCAIFVQQELALYIFEDTGER